MTNPPARLKGGDGRAVPKRLASRTRSRRAARVRRERAYCHVRTRARNTQPDVLAQKSSVEDMQKNPTENLDLFANRTVVLH